MPSACCGGQAEGYQIKITGDRVQRPMRPGDGTVNGVRENPVP